MRVMRGGWAMALAAFLVAGTGSGASAAIPTERLEAVDAYLPTVPDDLGVPGVALVIVDDGEVVREVALGVADGTGRPITPQTPFMLASTSKAFTALVVMQLVEAGVLDLDAPVQRYLPWFRVADEDASAAITLRHLLHHTSGLSLETGQHAHDADAQDADALERGIRGLATAVLVAPPGERYEYSNANYDTLGMVVQAVTGKPYSEVLEERVFGPLGMSHSHATVEAARADGLSEGFYPWWGSDWRPTQVTLPRAGGPSATTFVSVEDMGRALMAHLGGGSVEGRSVLSPEGVEAMQAPGSRIDDFHAYGMGWVIRPYWELLDPTAPVDGRFQLPTLVEHDGDWANARSYVGLVPSQGWGFAVLLNGNDETAPDRLSSVFGSLLSILAGREAVGPVESADLVARNARQLAILLLVLELVSLVWSLWWLVRRARRPMRTARRLAALLVPLALDLLVVWLALVFLPATYGASIWRILESVPDIGLIATVTLAIAVVWGTMRTLLMLATWWGARARPRPAIA